MTHDPATSDGAPPLEAVVRALDDPECRTILQELTEPMTAAELERACDVPRSTVYRKLDLLVEATLIRELLGVRPDGGRITRYERDVTGVTVELDSDNEFAVEVRRPSRRADERLADMWSRMGDEL